MNAMVAESARATVNQGDIICRPSAGVDYPTQWGFIVTADCDIYQDKAGARLSYLEIVTARHYLDHVWSGEVLRKLRGALIKEAADKISKAAQQLDPSYNNLSTEDLLTWLVETRPVDIIAMLELAPKKAAEHLELLERVELAYGIRASGRTPIQRLKLIWASQKASDATVRSRLMQALDYNRANDFHLIPSLPGSHDLGFVVLLREVNTLPHDSILGSALEHQIAGDSEKFYILGPSADNLRYAIAQKMAFLFSRIGMSEEYEDHCKMVSQLSVEEAMSQQSGIENAK